MMIFTNVGQLEYRNVLVHYQALVNMHHVRDDEIHKQVPVDILYIYEPLGKTF
jgi:hypothetical protein